MYYSVHQSILLEAFHLYYNTETFVDCTLAAEGKFLKAHKIVLSAFSPYFEAILKEQYDKHPIFLLKDVKYNELCAVMEYMYRGEMNVSTDELDAVLQVAESLQITGLTAGCMTPVSNGDELSDSPTTDPQKVSSLREGSSRPLEQHDPSNSSQNQYSHILTSRPNAPKPLYKLITPEMRKRLSMPDFRKSEHLRGLLVPVSNVGEMIDSLTTDTQNVSSLREGSCRPSEQHDTSSLSVPVSNGSELSDSRTTDTQKVSSLREGSSRPSEQHDPSNSSQNQYSQTLTSRRAFASATNAPKPPYEFNTLAVRKRLSMPDFMKSCSSQLLRGLSVPVSNGSELSDSRTTDTQKVSSLREGSSRPSEQHDPSNSSQNQYSHILTSRPNAPKPPYKFITPEMRKRLSMPDFRKSEHLRGLLVPVSNVGEMIDSLTTDTQNVSSLREGSCRPSEQHDTSSLSVPVSNGSELSDSRTTDTQKVSSLREGSSRPSEQHDPSNSSQNQYSQTLTSRRAFASATNAPKPPYEFNTLAVKKRLSMPDFMKSCSSQLLRDLSVPFSNGGELSDSRTTGPQNVSSLRKGSSRSSEQHDTSNSSQNRKKPSYEVISQVGKRLSRNNVRKLCSSLFEEQFAIAGKATNGDAVTLTADAGGSRDSTDDEIISLSDTTDDDVVSPPKVTKNNFRPHECEQCGKSYGWKGSLSRHKKFECGGKEPQVRCHYCPYKCKQPSNLGAHMRKHHPDKPPLPSKKRRSENKTPSNK